MKHILSFVLSMISFFGFTQTQYDGQAVTVDVKLKGGGSYYMYVSRKDSASFYLTMTPKGSNYYGVTPDSIELVSSNHRVSVSNDISLEDLSGLAADSINSIVIWWFMGNNNMNLEVRQKSRAEISNYMNRLVNLPYRIDYYPSNLPVALQPENGMTPGDYMIRAGEYRNASLITIAAASTLALILIDEETNNDVPKLLMGTGIVVGVGFHIGANISETKAGRLLNRR